VSDWNVNAEKIFEQDILPAVARWASFALSYAKKSPVHSLATPKFHISESVRLPNQLNHPFQANAIRAARDVMTHRLIVAFGKQQTR
jgi:hypothetical protein